VTTRFPALASSLSQVVLTLRELDEQSSRELLRTLAQESIEPFPEQTRALITTLGGLPLALQLAGNHLRREGRYLQPRRIAAAFEHLTNRSERLQLVQAYAPLDSHPASSHGGASVSLHSTLAISDQHLSDPARAVFYALAALPEKPATFSEEAALAVACCSNEALDELTDTGILEPSSGERYSLHQVIADYARLQFQAQPRERQAEVYRRLLDYSISYALSHQDDLDLIARECYLYRRALDEADTWGFHRSFVLLSAALATYIRVCMIYAAESYMARAIELAKEMDEIYPHPIHLLHERTLMRLHQGDCAMASSLAEAGLRAAKEAGDTKALQLFTDLRGIEELRLTNLPSSPDPCGGTPFATRTTREQNPL